MTKTDPFQALLAIGDEINPGLVLVLNRHPRGSIQARLERRRADFLLQVVKRHPDLIE